MLRRTFGNTNVEVSAISNIARGLGGDETRRRHRLRRSDLDFEPCPVAPLVAPDSPHVGVGVARNHNSRSRGMSSPLTLPSTVADSDPGWKTSAATRCTSSAVTRSMPCSVSSSPNCLSK